MSNEPRNPNFPNNFPNNIDINIRARRAYEESDRNRWLTLGLTALAAYGAHKTVKYLNKVERDSYDEPRPPKEEEKIKIAEELDKIKEEKTLQKILRKKDGVFWNKLEYMGTKINEGENEIMRLEPQYKEYQERTNVSNKELRANYEKRDIKKLSDQYIDAFL